MALWSVAGAGLCEQETTCPCPGPLIFPGWLLLMRPTMLQITGDTFNCFTSSVAASLAQFTWICLSELTPGDSHFELQVFLSCTMDPRVNDADYPESRDKLAC